MKLFGVSGCVHCVLVSPYTHLTLSGIRQCELLHAIKHSLSKRLI